MKKEWTKDKYLPAALEELTVKLRAWNKGNIFRHKRRNELRLGGVQKAMANRCSNFLIALERELKMERNLILQQEEMLWLQKSRIEWLKSSDKNTRFFHTSTVVRRRRNMIQTLKDYDGNWVEGKEQLKDMAVAFYADLFRSNRCTFSPFITGLFPNVETRHQGV